MVLDDSYCELRRTSRPVKVTFRNLHVGHRCAEYEVRGQRLVTAFDRSRVTVFEGDDLAVGELELGRAYAIPGLKRGVVGVLVGSEVLMQRPRYGFTKSSRRIIVSRADGGPERIVQAIDIARFMVLDDSGRKLLIANDDGLFVDAEISFSDLLLCVLVSESGIAGAARVPSQAGEFRVAMTSLKS